MGRSTPRTNTHDGFEDHYQSTAAGGYQGCRASSIHGWGFLSGWTAIGLGMVAAMSCVACVGAGGGGSGSSMRRLRNWGFEQQARMSFQRWALGAMVWSVANSEQVRHAAYVAPRLTSWRRLLPSK
eukprot:1815518-Pyramimonas_sp.AAC.1